MGDLKETLCTGSPGVDHTFWDTFSVEIGKFLHQMVVLKENWTCQNTKKIYKILYL